MDIFITILHLFILSFISIRWFQRQPSGFKKYFLSALSAKILSGICVGLLYTYYYQTGDTFVYFNDGKMLTSLAKQDPSGYLNFLWSDEPRIGSHGLVLSEPRALFFVKFVSVVNLITVDNYWLTASYFSLLSFAAAWYLFRVIARYFPDDVQTAFLAFLFFPSVIFWTSGLVKECIASAALFYLTALFLKAWFDRSVDIAASILGVVALWVLWGLKYYYAAIFFPVTITCLLYKFVFAPLIMPKRFLSETFLWLAIFLVPLFLVSFMHPNFYLKGFLEVIVSNNEIYNLYSDPDDLIRFRELEPTIGSVVWNSPIALFSGLFRPFIFEAGNLFQIAVAIENAALLLLAFSSLKNLLEVSTSPHRILVLAILVYVVMLCIFLTLSTPNFGTLSRYRIGYLPFFIFIVVSGNPVLRFLERRLGRLVQ